MGGLKFLSEHLRTASFQQMAFPPVKNSGEDAQFIKEKADLARSALFHRFEKETITRRLNRNHRLGERFLPAQPLARPR